MASSLLAHLLPHIRGSQEDIATYSLQYLLSQSKELNRAFTKRLFDVLHIGNNYDLQFICQATGKNEEKERPDMAGLDSRGNEKILLEMKFYASLTPNQPLTYLDRIESCNGEGLVFVCPYARQTNLWSKLIELCKGRNIEIIDERCVKVNGIKLAIMTWTEIIELLKQVSDFSAIRYSSDVAQLEGYCNQIDSDAFVPFTAEDLSAKMANKAERYYQVVDEVIELLCMDGKYQTSKKGLKATGYRKGYVRYLYINEQTISLNYDRDMWKNPDCEETPFWIAISQNWKQSNKILEKLNAFQESKKQSNGKDIFLALEPLQNATFSEVCEDLKKQIENYIEILK